MRIFILLILAAILIGCQGPDSDFSLDTNVGSGIPYGYDSLQANVEAEIDVLNSMRSGLAQTFTADTVDQATFDAVCKPIGMRAREISLQKGWQIRQIAERNRNPEHELDEEGRIAFGRFLSDSTLTAFWSPASGGGYRYFKRITVESACLACHGEKDRRPAFIVEKYPDDRAHGFKTGDLRGVFSVYIPDSLLIDTTSPGR